MSEPLRAESFTTGAAVHDHTWQLISIETDCGVEVRELLCTGCSAVQING